MYTMPGGLERLYFCDGATPCNCPSLGRPFEDFPNLPQPAVTIITARAKKADRFFIFILLKGIGRNLSFTDFITSLEFNFNNCKLMVLSKVLNDGRNYYIV